MGLFSSRKPKVGQGTQPASRTVNRLCKTCASIFRKPDFHATEINQVTLVPYLSRPLRNHIECALCSFICTIVHPNVLSHLDSLQRSTAPPVARLANKSCRSRRERGQNWQGLMYQDGSLLLEIFEQTAGGQLQLLVPIFDIDTRGGYPPLIPLESTSTASQHSLDQLWEWVTNCQQNHPRCRQLTGRSSRSQSWHPTRLLDIRDPERLILREGFPLCDEPLQYAALSYSWGRPSREVPKLLPKTHEHFLRHGIIGSSCPQLFRDVAKVLLALGINYLWIDSLCIIQEDGPDRRHELEHMNMIYKHAYVAIMADVTPDPHHSLFTARRPETLNGCTFVSPQRYSNKSQQWKCRLSDPYASLERHSVPQRRAWVLQEQFLSPRIIHFGNGQAFFNCGSVSYCESFPQGFNRPELRLHDSRRSFMQMRAPLRSESPHTFEEFIVQWHRIVNDYTRRGITNISDRLPAISALATEVQHSIFSDLDYLAGLWGTMLVYQLCWFSEAARVGHETGRYNSQHPSWSWATLDGAVTMPEVTTQITRAQHNMRINPPPARVVDIRLKPSECRHRPDIRIETGSIYLRCPILPIRYRKFQVQLDHGLYRWDLAYPADRPGGKMLLQTHLDHSTHFDDAAVFFLPITNKTSIDGLLVQPTGRARGQYRRIGQVDTRVHDLETCLMLLSGSKEPRVLEKGLFREFYNFWDYEIELV